MSIVFTLWMAIASLDILSISSVMVRYHKTPRWKRLYTIFHSYDRLMSILHSNCINVLTFLLQYMVRYKDVSLYFYEWKVSFLLKTENEIFLEWIEPEITHVQSLLILYGYLFDADDCIFCYEGEASEMG